MGAVIHVVDRLPGVIEKDRRGHVCRPFECRTGDLMKE
jgi:hypothetical protein